MMVDLPVDPQKKIRELLREYVCDCKKAVREAAAEEKESHKRFEKFLRKYNRATDKHCACGGGSAKDGCPACKVYHELIDKWGAVRDD